MSRPRSDLAPADIIAPRTIKHNPHAVSRAQLFKQVVDALWKTGRQEWAPGNWSFTCSQYDKVLENVMLDDREERFCDLAVAGIKTDEVPGTRN